MIRQSFETGFHVTLLLTETHTLATFIDWEILCTHIFANKPMNYKQHALFYAFQEFNLQSKLNDKTQNKIKSKKQQRNNNLHTYKGCLGVLDLWPKSMLKLLFISIENERKGNRMCGHIPNSSLCVCVCSGDKINNFEWFEPGCNRRRKKKLQHSMSKHA